MVINTFIQMQLQPLKQLSSACFNCILTNVYMHILDNFCLYFCMPWLVINFDVHVKTCNNFNKSTTIFNEKQRTYNEKVLINIF